MIQSLICVCVLPDPFSGNHIQTKIVYNLSDIHLSHSENTIQCFLCKTKLLLDKFQRFQGYRKSKWKSVFKTQQKRLVQSNSESWVCGDTDTQVSDQNLHWNSSSKIYEPLELTGANNNSKVWGSSGTVTSLQEEKHALVIH